MLSQPRKERRFDFEASFFRGRNDRHEDHRDGRVGAVYHAPEFPPLLLPLSTLQEPEACAKTSHVLGAEHTAYLRLVADPPLERRCDCIDSQCRVDLKPNGDQQHLSVTELTSRKRPELGCRRLRPDGPKAARILDPKSGRRQHDRDQNDDSPHVKLPATRPAGEIVHRPTPRLVTALENQRVNTHTESDAGRDV